MLHLIENHIFKFLAIFTKDAYALKLVYKVRIGKKCRLNKNNYGSEPYLLKFGDFVSAINVDFVTHDGAVWVFRQKEPRIELLKSINIGSNVFIGTKSIILPGSNIGSNVIIGAGSVVKGQIASGFVYAGVPAKKICTIDEFFTKNKDDFSMTKLMKYNEKREYILKFLNKK